jgi:hypothetical protein
MIVRWQDKWHFFIVSPFNCVLFTVTGMNLWACNYLWIAWLAEKSCNGLKLQHDLTMIKQSKMKYLIVEFYIPLCNVTKLYMV